jgi:hypothetical protein
LDDWSCDGTYAATVPRSSDVAAGGERPTPTPYLTLLARLGEAVRGLRTRAIGWTDIEDAEVAREVFDAYVDLVEASQHQSQPYRGDTFQSAQSGNVMDPATWEYIPDQRFATLATEPGTNAVDADPNFIAEPRQAANVTRLPDTAEPAFDLITKAAVAVSRLIAERDGLADQRDRQAEYIERLEAKVREMEGET